MTALINFRERLEGFAMILDWQSYYPNTFTARMADAAYYIVDGGGRIGPISVWIVRPRPASAWLRPSRRRVKLPSNMLLNVRRNKSRPAAIF